MFVLCLTDGMSISKRALTAILRTHSKGTVKTQKSWCLLTQPDPAAMRAALLRLQRTNLVGDGDVFGMPRRGKQTRPCAL